MVASVLATPAACGTGTFPVNQSSVQIMSLHQAKAASSVAECIQACCADAKCVVWQFAVAGPAHPVNTCWIGETIAFGSPQSGWVGASKAGTPSPPKPPPPPPAGPYNVDDAPGLGLRWEGVGAISGGGATTKLLMDYDPAVSSEILDYLFKPNFGLNLQILKVEMGGDADATEGAEPSHMHFAGDEDYNRGYEWWLMKEAKARNPDIKLYGLPWAWPGWLDPSATADKPAKDAFTNANVTANYTLAWLLAAKRVHNLDIDYIGQWNERNAPSSYNDALRAAVAGATELRTTVLNRLPHYPGTGVAPDPQGCTDKQWNTTDGEFWVDEEGSVADGQSARCLARCVSRNYVTGCHTATFQWHLISSFYDYLPWKRCGVAVANTPWSGSYEVTSPTWSLAHTSQFAPIGWRYASHQAGVGLLSKGGSYVTRVSPDKKDFSIVVEKMSQENSHCARGNNPPYDTSAEQVVLILKGSFLQAAGSSLRLWYSNLAEGNASPQLFVKMKDIPVVDGKVTLAVQPEEIYTITTLDTGFKGNHSVKPPADFPLPYRQSFDDESPSSPARLWYDQMGAWEIQPRKGGSGNVMRQVVPIWPNCWGYACSVFTAGFNMSFEVNFEDDASMAVGQESSMLNISTAGTWSLGSHTGTVSFAANSWHTVSVSYAASQTVTVDGKVLFSGAGKLSASASPIKLQLSRYVFASWDNFAIVAA